MDEERTEEALAFSGSLFNFLIMRCEIGKPLFISEVAGEYLVKEGMSGKDAELTEVKVRRTEAEGSKEKTTEFTEVASEKTTEFDEKAGDFSSEEIPVKKDSKFTTSFEKAILYKWHSTRDQIRKLLRMEFPVFASSKFAIQMYVDHFAFFLLSDTESDIFENILVVSAFIFELVTFCYERGYPDYILYAPVCWVKVFMRYFAVKFFEVGGWKEMKSKKAYMGLLYDKVMYTFGVVERLRRTKKTTAQGLSA